MSRWLLILALPGGVVIAAGCVLFRLWQRCSRPPFVQIDQLIKPPVQKFTGHDEGLAKLTQQRRVAADRIRTRASMVESGAPVSDVLRMVKR